MFQIPKQSENLQRPIHLKLFESVMHSQCSHWILATFGINSPVITRWSKKSLSLHEMASCHSGGTEDVIVIKYWYNTWTNVGKLKRQDHENLQPPFSGASRAFLAAFKTNTSNIKPLFVEKSAFRWTSTLNLWCSSTAVRRKMKTKVTQWKECFEDAIRWTKKDPAWENHWERSSVSNLDAYLASYTPDNYGWSALLPCGELDKLITFYSYLSLITTFSSWDFHQIKNFRFCPANTRGNEVF